MFQKTSGSEKNLWIRGGYHFFCSLFFRLTFTKIFFGNSSVLQIISGSKKIVWMGEGDLTFFFRRNIFESQYRNIFWALFGVSNFFWYGKKHMDKMGVSHVSANYFLSHNTEKVNWNLISVSNNFW